MTTFPPLTHVALTVRDLGVSVPWYEALLGAKPVLDEDTEPNMHHTVYLMGGGTLLGLHQHQTRPSSARFSEFDVGLDHVAFGCASRSELEQWASRLDELGVAHGGIVDAHYGSGVSFRDPDGIALEFFAPPRDVTSPALTTGGRHLLRLPAGSGEPRSGRSVAVTACRPWPRRPGPPPLHTALEGLRLDGAIFFRAEFTENWEFSSPLRELTPVIRPGATRLILFHIVAAGRCWVAADGGARHWANRGDVIVLPYGDDYTMGGAAPADQVSLLHLIARPPWASMPVVTHGAGGERTDIVCGYLHTEDPLFDPKLHAFPPAFVVHLPDGPAARWVESSIDYALSVSGGGIPADGLSTRLPELLLIEVLRTHLAGAPAAEHGWLAAMHDPVLSPAIARLHERPERKWTVAMLAAEVAVSRSALDDRFRTVLGMSPIRYLTEWRMHTAHELLQTTDLTIAAVARRVGYDSEEAFGRAYKRSRGRSPGTSRGA